MIEKPLVFAGIWIVQVTDPSRLSTADKETVQAVADSDPRLAEAHQDTPGLAAWMRQIPSLLAPKMLYDLINDF